MHQALPPSVLPARPARWLLLLMLALVLPLLPLVPAWAQCPAVGAIRWDAWFGDKGAPGRAVEASLGPERWHGRLPACAEVLGPDKVRIACDTPDQMASEMRDAVAAGIDFWAFVTYPDDDPMSGGLKAYLASSAKPAPKFALLTEFNKWGDSKTYPANAERFLRMMADPRYQRTADGRPLLFLGFVTEAAMAQRFGGRAGFAAVVADFRQRAQAAKLGNPYVVLLDGRVDRAQAQLRELGLDGVSAYVVGDNRVRQGSYQQLTAMVEKFWREASASGMALVPPVMTGWDRRPRVQNPVPWERGLYQDAQMDQFFAQPTPDELQRHLAAAMDHSQRHTAASRPRAVLVYAWNEFDEGGWLAPTRAEGRSRLDAVRRAVASACPTRQ